MVEEVRDLFIRYGIRSVTMNDIARELGVSKKTLYQEVDSKDELVRKVMEFDMNEEREAMIAFGETCSDAIDQMVQTTVFLMQKMRKISPVCHYDLRKYHGVLWSELESRHLNFIYDFLKRNIEWGQEKGLYRKAAAPEIISRFFVHMASAAVNEMYFPLDTYQRDQLLMQLISYHINGITTPKGVKLWRKHKQNLDNEYIKE